MSRPCVESSRKPSKSAGQGRRSGLALTNPLPRNTTLPECVLIQSPTAVSATFPTEFNEALFLIVTRRLRKRYPLHHRLLEQMRRHTGTLFELLALTLTTVYLFWRWADHSSRGNPVGFYLSFNLVLAALPLLFVATVMYLTVPKSRLRAIAAACALTISLCYLASMGSDLRRFQILGGPGSKEMQNLVMNQDLLPGTVGQWLQGAALRIRREFCSTALISLLLVAYVLRLSTAYGRYESSTTSENGVSSCSRNH